MVCGDDAADAALGVSVTTRIPRVKKRWPFTLWLGIFIIATCETLLFIDVNLSHRGPVHSAAERMAISNPQSGLGEAARWMAGNMTAIVWVGYLIFLEGLLTRINGASPARKRPHHFFLLCLASIFIWGVFDMINFNLDMRAWVYIGMRPSCPACCFPGRC
jgi:hypothetical protein